MQANGGKRRSEDRNASNKKTMLGRFYIKYQKKVNQIHQQEVPDGAVNFILKGMIKTFGTSPQTLTQNIPFKRVNAELLDFAFFLYDADKDARGNQPDNGTAVPF